MKNVNGKLLKRLIILSGMSNRQLAKRIHITPNTLSNIILGNTYPSYVVIARLQVALEISIEDMIEVFFPWPPKIAV
ncbi:helix-turn-helix transcriptional regulator [Ruoffia tabacinasalis]|uniref:Helix-turn-helix transcriptional regulator n=1 Tax=Ruoffia tabacinasalis TaxID=87458 RepID=A0ABS0LHL0_9LACT|nr:helix-turn-helix transcriptional regulator [Ruoffia tabacinasalis]MBG9977780.1 helix-turn-helix transcriptional regulator [Ruoffia tabacinasalis]